MNQWIIGDVKVSRIVEREFTIKPKDLLPDVRPTDLLPIGWLSPRFIDRKGHLMMSIHALIIETPEQTIVVDTCVGNDKQCTVEDWSMLQGPFLEDLAAAGYPAQSIDTVLCTHLHFDHVGWNTMQVNGQWVPTFPNARYLLSKNEYDYWLSEANDEEHEAVMAESIKPVFDAGLVDLVDMNHRICKEVWLEPTPGHTPGHVSVHIQSNATEAIITGDSFHHPCQVARSSWSSSFDYDTDASKETRDQLLEKYSGQPTLVIGTHFATPTAGYFEEEGNEHWFRALEQ